MKITIDHVGQFRDAVHRAGRGNQFSYKAQEILFDYLEDCDPDYELDVIALCCEYCEMTDDEVRESYDVPEDQEVAEFLEENTSYLGTTTGTECHLFVQF